MATPFLMYHELGVPGRAPCEDAPGYLRYVVERSVFVEHLDLLAAQRMSVCGVAAACRRGLDHASQVVITFDDGCATDAELAAPLLAARGFGATFFIVSEWTGTRRGFMTAAQVRELHGQGFEVASHSATHAFLSDLADDRLREELRGSRQTLEDMIGAPVRHLSCPGGRWSPRVAAAAREAGYETVSPSRLGVNRARADRYALARRAIRRDTTRRNFEAICHGRQPVAAQFGTAILNGAKRALGNRLYGGLRNLALRQP